MPDNSKALSKLIIHSFDKDDFNVEDKSKLFTTPINPESFTKNYKVELDTKRGHGQSTTNPHYISSAPQELKIEFILDGTKTLKGYVDEYKDLDVHAQLQKLLECVYDIKDEIHRPRFLNVQWGSEKGFNCVLSSLDINHTLFNPNGSPLRVKINASFIHYVSQEERAKGKSHKSPDLTHYKRVNKGDRLDLLTYKVYNTPKYFLQIGRVNNLTSVRNLKAGIQLYLPPLDKTET
jgi:Contractile injection system tube protein